MATELWGPNKFIRLRKSIAAIIKDIGFLRKCKECNVIPKCMKIKVKCKVPVKVLKKIEIGILNDELAKKYSILDIRSREAYYLHLKLAKEYPFEFPSFLT